MLGLSQAEAANYSVLFDLGGILPVILTGWVMQRFFNGNWACVCLLTTLGSVASYVLVLISGENPYTMAASFGLVGFMIYAADSLLKGVASVVVAGGRDGLAVAGLVNGFASAAPIIQELVIGGWMKQNETVGMLRATRLGLCVSYLFVLTMALATYLLHRRTARAALNDAAEPGPNPENASIRHPGSLSRRQLLLVPTAIVLAACFGALLFRTRLLGKPRTPLKPGRSLVSSDLDHLSLGTWSPAHQPQNR